MTNAPRLLLASRDRPSVREAVARKLPEIPFAFLGDVPPPPGSEVEAVLFGSASREAKGFDPRAYPKLRFVQRLFAGVDDVPFDRFPDGVKVAANAGGYAPFVAEHAVALALAAARSLREGHRMVEVGSLRPAPEMRTLRGRTAVILGYGAIGRAIAERLRPFGVRIAAVTRTGAPIAGVDAVHPSDRLVDALREGGVVFEARPLTDRTSRSLGPAELAAMPPDAILVNVGRAGTIDEEALASHLANVPTFRAASDVWWEEDFAAGRLHDRRRLASLPNFLGTPHLAGIAPGAEEYALGTALDNLARFFRGEPPRFVVDRSEYGGLSPKGPVDPSG